MQKIVLACFCFVLFAQSLLSQDTLKLINGKEKIVKFGLNNSGGTFFDGATEDKKENYIARHGKMGEK